MARKTTPDQLAGFLRYLLERRPDEFGLIPDPEGWFRLKDLLNVFMEEPGWRHIRIHDLNEIRMMLPNPPFIIKEGAIRGRMIENRPRPVAAENPPKLLFTCIRPRAHPHVAGEGISPSTHPCVISTMDQTMALRMGKRIDPKPVLLTIHTAKALEQGIMFERFGETIFLSGHIPTTCFSGPPLPREPDTALSREPKPDIRPPIQTPGSFFIDPTEIMPTGGKPARKGAKKEIPWKKERKRRKRRPENTKEY